MPAPHGQGHALAEVERPARDKAGQRSEGLMHVRIGAADEGADRGTLNEGQSDERGKHAGEDPGDELSRPEGLCTQARHHIDVGADDGPDHE